MNKKRIISILLIMLICTETVAVLIPTASAVSGETHYINSQTDVDSVADIGTHSGFDAQKAKDNVYDSISEAATQTPSDTNVGVTSGSGADYTLGANANQMTGIKINTGAVSGTLSSIKFYGLRVSSPGANVKGVLTDGSGNIISLSSGSVLVSATSVTQYTLTFPAGVSISASTDYWFGLIGDASWNIGYYSVGTQSGFTDTSNSYSSPTSPTDASSRTTKLRVFGVVTSTYNYALALEEQFTGFTTGYSNQYLCIKTSDAGTETLSVQGWNTGNSTWTTIGSITGSGFNNFTVSAWISSSTFTIRFVDASSAGDNTQNNWGIDATLLYLYNDNQDYPRGASDSIGILNSAGRSYGTSRNSNQIMSILSGVNNQLLHPENIEQIHNQSFTTTAHTGSPWSTSFTVNTPTSGNTMFAIIHVPGGVSGSGNGSVVSISQTNVSWTRAVQKIYNNVISDIDIEIWYGLASTGASNSVSITFISGDFFYPNGFFMEYSGIDPVNPVDVTATDSGASTSLLTGTTAITSTPIELFIGGLGIYGSDVPTTPQNGFDLNNVNSGYFRCSQLLKISDTLDTANSGASTTNAARYAGVIATFKPRYVESRSFFGNSISLVSLLLSNSRSFSGNRDATTTASLLTSDTSFFGALRTFIQTLNIADFIGRLLGIGRSNTQSANLLTSDGRALAMHRSTASLTTLLASFFRIENLGRESTQITTLLTHDARTLQYFRVSDAILEIATHNSPLKFVIYVEVPSNETTPSGPEPGFYNPTVTLDVLVSTMHFQRMWWAPDPSFDVNVINKGLTSTDITFEYQVVDAHTNTLAYSGNQTVYIQTGVTKTLSIAVPGIDDGMYNVKVTATHPVQATGDGNLYVESPIYGQSWFTVIVIVAAIIIFLLILRRRR